MEEKEKIKILLVEDDDIDVRSFERSLRKAKIDYSIEVCTYANEAINLLTNKDDYDCIFLDYQLPGMDGLSLLIKIRELGIEKPIAVLTSQGDEKVAVEMMKAGAFDYFPKYDVNPSKIGRTVSSMINFNKIAEEKREIEKSLENHKQFIQVVTNSSPNIIYVLDIQSSKYLFLNRSIYKDLGYSDEHINANKVNIQENTIHPEDIPKVKKHYKELSEKEDNSIFELEFRMKNSEGNWVWFLSRDTIFKRNEDKRVSQILGSTSNINNLKKVETELISAKQQAEQAAKIKSEFLSNMSHEIRTPMNAIIGLTDLLLSEENNSIVEDNLQSIKQSADNLLVIINDILDFSKIEAGKLILETINFNFTYQLNHIQKTLAYKSEEKGLEFDVVIDPKIPNFLLGDPFRLNQIIINLAGNSIKFTDKGHIKIIANLVKLTDDKVDLQIVVKDTGIGISKEKQNSIFESFTQADTNITRFFGGTGLGLTITKQLVDLMNGSIRVESELGEGSEFILDLRFEKGKGQKMKIPTKIIEKDLAGINILVMEDNIFNQKVISQILRQWNCNMVIADNGQLGLEELLKSSFDIILMDLQMPVMDGFETAKAIKTDQKFLEYKDIPIIALTADAFPETKSKVFDKGMSDFVSKPFERLDLNHKISKYTQGK